MSLEAVKIITLISIRHILSLKEHIKHLPIKKKTKLSAQENPQLVVEKN